MKRFLSYPLMGLALLGFWLLLNQSLAPGHILLGALIAVIALSGLSALQPEPVRIRFSWTMVRLAGMVLADIFRSNLAVGKIILARGKRDVQAGFLELPLDMTNRYGLAVLGIVITATPGTLWMQYDPARNVLLLHVLDLVDEEHWIRLIKSRYERLLMEIFR